MFKTKQQNYTKIDNYKMKKLIGNINPDVIFSFAEKGIARASGFAGVVLNSKNVVNIKQWCINENFVLIPELKNNKNSIDEFKSFVAKSALCEMVMLFETTLNKLYENILLFENTKKGNVYNIENHQDLLKQFVNNAFETKLAKIKKIIDFDNDNNELWKNLKYTRNCISHNHCLVDKGDIKLVIPAFTVKYLNNKTNEEIYSTPEAPVANLKNFIGCPMTVFINYEYRKKIFNKGDIITFTSHEINFLIFSMKNSINDLKRKYIEYLLKNGVAINFRNNIIKTVDELNKCVTQNKQVMYFSLNKKKD